MGRRCSTPLLCRRGSDVIEGDHVLIVVATGHDHVAGRVGDAGLAGSLNPRYQRGSSRVTSWLIALSASSGVAFCSTTVATLSTMVCVTLTPF